MEYKDIPKDIRRYIRKSTYIYMDYNERKSYLSSVESLCVSDIQDQMENLSFTNKRLGTRKLKFVGMRFHGSHVFTFDDDVKLEMAYNSFVKHPLIHVMMKESKKWKHVAYVERDDAKWLSTIDGFESLPLCLYSIIPIKALYTIDLKSLEDNGVRIKTKKEVLKYNTTNEYPMFNKLWHNYPDVDYLFIDGIY